MKKRGKIIILILLLGVLIIGGISIYFILKPIEQTELIVHSDLTGVPNPSGAYCYALYPNQPITIGTCHYAGRGENNRVLCEGECGYGCACLPICEKPSSEPCWRATDIEVTCGCGGDSCEKPCFFPDGTNCSMWDFYRGKCGQEWSYCALKGYDLKNLSQNEGWFQDGAICIDKNTKEEIGNVFNLVNEEWVKQNK